MRPSLLAPLFALVLLPAGSDLARANARLIDVTPLDGGCLSGPKDGMNGVQQWDVESGRTYRLTLAGVSECADGGTAPTLNVRMNSSGVGNQDLVAALLSPGVYAFDFAIPNQAGCTMPILYCSTPGQSNSGLRVIRDDGVDRQAHLRMASFGPGCRNPVPIPDCVVTATRATTWGKVKAIYR